MCASVPTMYGIAHNLLFSFSLKSMQNTIFTLAALMLTSILSPAYADDSGVSTSARTVAAAAPPPPAALQSDTVSLPLRYVIRSGDVLHISVWREKDLQAEVQVGPDGTFSFPLVGEVTAAGKTMPELRQELVQRIRKFVSNPLITVSVKQPQANRIYVLGKVNRPGEFAVNRETDVMQALGLAGGTTPFASVNKIKVLRRSASGEQHAIQFRYDDVERGRDLEQNIFLQGGDVVVVP